MGFLKENGKSLFSALVKPQIFEDANQWGFIENSARAFGKYMMRSTFDLGVLYLSEIVKNPDVSDAIGVTAIAMIGVNFVDGLTRVVRNNRSKW